MQVLEACQASSQVALPLVPPNQLFPTLPPTFPPTQVGRTMVFLRAGQLQALQSYDVSSDLSPLTPHLLFSHPPSTPPRWGAPWCSCARGSCRHCKASSQPPPSPLPPAFHHTQVGRTMVFLRAGQLQALEACRSQRVDAAAAAIQRAVRRYLWRKHRLHATIAIQSAWRGYLTRSIIRVHRERRAAVRIQSWWRGLVVRCGFLELRRVAILLQRRRRGQMAQYAEEWQQQHWAAITIQVGSLARGASESFEATQKMLYGADGLIPYGKE
ncbi:unnamed protein product [Closterium sp. NIES-53]